MSAQIFSSPTYTNLFLGALTQDCTRYFCSNAKFSK